MQELVQKQAEEAATAKATADAAAVAADAAAVAEAKIAADAAMASAAAAEEWAKDYFLAAEWSPEAVVPKKVVCQQKREYLNSLWASAGAWHNAGLIKITFANLFFDPDDSSAPMEALRELVGSGYWSALYGNRTVLASHLVPQQMYQVIMHALNTIATSLSEGTEKKATELLKTKAAGRLQLLKTNLKAAKSGKA
jgi:hypothetical protein